MQAEVLERLTDAEVEATWADLYRRGKHEPTLTRGSRVPTFTRHGRWVLVRLPIAWLNHTWLDDHQEPSPTVIARIERYAREPGELPPGLALYNERAARRRLPMIYVADGNHRVVAASLRGQSHALMFMPEDDFERYLTTRKKLA